MVRSVRPLILGPGMIVKDAIYEGAAILAIVDTITIGVEGLTILVELGAAGGAKVLWTRIGDPDICAIGVFFATDRGRLLVTHGNAITTEAHLGRTGVELVGNEIAVGVGVDKLVEGILVGVGGVGGQDLRDEVVVLGVVLGFVVGLLGLVHLLGGIANASLVTRENDTASAVITDILHGILGIVPGFLGFVLGGKSLVLGSVGSQPSIPGGLLAPNPIGAGEVRGIHFTPVGPFLLLVGFGLNVREVGKVEFCELLLVKGIGSYTGRVGFVRQALSSLVILLLGQVRLEDFGGIVDLLSGDAEGLLLARDGSEAGAAHLNGTVALEAVVAGAGPAGFSQVVLEAGGIGAGAGGLAFVLVGVVLRRNGWAAVAARELGLAVTAGGASSHTAGGDISYGTLRTGAFVERVARVGRHSVNTHGAPGVLWGRFRRGETAIVGRNGDAIVEDIVFALVDVVAAGVPEAGLAVSGVAGIADAVVGFITLVDVATRLRMAQGRVVGRAVGSAAGERVKASVDRRGLGSDEAPTSGEDGNGHDGGQDGRNLMGELHDLL